MLKFLHEVGTIMYHDEKSLRQTVVLDPVKFIVEPATKVSCFCFFVFVCFVLCFIFFGA